MSENQPVSGIGPALHRYQTYYILCNTEKFTQKFLGCPLLPAPSKVAEEHLPSYFMEIDSCSFLKL